MQVKQLFTIFAASEVFFIACNKSVRLMELKEGLEFYQKCLDSAKRTMTELMTDKSISKEKREALIDMLLDRIIDIQKRIEAIEELLR